MGTAKKIGILVLKSLVEGKFLRRCREELDRLLGQFTRWIMVHCMKSQPNKIFFHTQENRYCCNPKYICEELRRRNTDMDIVWRVQNGKRGSIPSDVRIVSNGTYNYFKEMFTSKYIITNSVLYVQSPFSLRRDQVLFETWHGSLGIKRFGKKDYKAGWRWVRAAIHTGHMTDYCITNSSFVSSSLRATYWEKTPMLEYGHPRNDIMFDSFADRRKEIRDAFLEKHHIEEDVHFVLYGPTFRDSKNFSCYAIDMDGLIEALRERFGGTWKLLLRYHSALRTVYKKKNKIVSSEENKIINVTDYDDMQELITLADVAITDYSSWIYDFMLQRRPGFIFATDIDLYNNERGFCYPLETTPFPIARNNEELLQNILEFDEKAYLERLEAFLLDKGCVEDGHASERVVDFILNLMRKDNAIVQ